ncbi:MAG: tetratricopeptide repeat protein [Candidatus Kapaibacterium sp.]
MRKKNNQKNINQSKKFIGGSSFISGSTFKFIAIALISLAVIISYSNSLNASFQFDDYLNFVEHSKGITPEWFSQPSNWLNYMERPVSAFTLAMQWEAHGEDVTGYHIVNIAIHIAVSVLVFFFALFILRNADTGHLRDKITLAALFAALIYALHPLQTQAVTYIVQRHASMAAMFYIMSIIFYVLGRKNHLQNGMNSRNIIFYFGALLTFLLAFFSKQNALTAPAAWLLVEFYFIRGPKGKRDIRFLLISLIALAALFVLALALTGLPRETEEISRGQYLLTQFYVIVEYFKLMIFPVGQNIDHDIALAESFFNLREILSFLFVAATVALGVWLYKRDKIISFSIFWFYLTLLVESSVIPIQDVMFEHRLYLPIFGFALSLSYGVFRLSGRRSSAVAAALLLILSITYVAMSYARNEIWQTKYTLWSDAYAKAPDKPRVIYNLANEYKDTGQSEKAVSLYEKAVRLDPSFKMPYTNLSTIYNQKGEYKKTIALLKPLENSLPKHYKAFNNLGLAYHAAEDYENAEKFLLKALSIKPDFAESYANLGLIYSKLGEYDKAIANYNKAAELAPSLSGKIYINMGGIYNQSGQFEKAVEIYSKAVELEPDLPGAFYNLAIALENTGRTQRAIENLEQAIKIDPNMAIAYKRLSHIHQKIGNESKSKEFAAKALRAGKIKNNYSISSN